jgi:hypothetical protein
MTSQEYINKHFCNGFAPKDVNISDHFALGCKLIIDGQLDAGVKMIRGSIIMINKICNQEAWVDAEGFVKSGFTRISKTAEESMVNYAKKNPVGAFHAVKPHKELLAIGPAKEREAVN